MQEPTAPRELAAIDLGSNSFQLLIVREVNGELQVIDRISEKVQQAAGLDANRCLDAESIERGLACLERFAQRLAGHDGASVRCVGTNTLRTAHNRNQFISPAEKILNCPVEVISGREEARLIYLGVAHTLSDDEDRRLVIDIGGGSTEFIIGERFAPLELESLHIGCVSYTTRFFSDGKLSAKKFQKAVDAAHLELLNIRKRYRQLGWADAVGSSGTIKAIQRLGLAQGWVNEFITLDSLLQLRDHLLSFEHLDQVEADDIKTARLQVLPAGLAILIAAFESLQIESMVYADGSLREGLLYDQIGRQQHEDVRERTLGALIERYQIDTDHAQNVDATAQYLLQQTDLNTPANASLLHWASRLHEIGLAISHSQFQKHGAYLIRHGDLMGFNRAEQQRLGLLVRCHRRKLSNAELELFPEEEQKPLLGLIILLRLAIILHHSRLPEQVPELTLQLKKKSLHLSFPFGWLEEHSLTEADLCAEQAYLKAAGYELNLD